MAGGWACLWAFFIPVVCGAGVLAGGPWLLAGLAYMFVAHPLVDAWSGASDAPAGGGSAALDLLPVFALPAQALLLLVGLRALEGRGALGFVGAAVSVGLSGGALGITAAHELVHRRAFWQRACGSALLALVGYAHFRVEHVYGHHLRVATRADPATSRLGESLYAFWARALAMSLVSAWRLEAPRGWRRNRVLWGFAAEAALAAACGLAFGAVGAAFYLAQSLVAALLLETINYIEHYGLARRELRPGVYEPVADRHSWDCTRRFTNWSLFNLGLHAEHHRRASLEYARLSPSPAAPRLPYGYSTMLMLALVPPAWRAVMDPRARAAASA
jgi:alkane 1-monooxygenase